MSVSQQDIKKLFGRSAGRCNICKKELTQEDIQLGEMKHIIAKKSNGPRGNEKNENNNSYDNLILLCPNHHSEVDQNQHQYTIEVLKEIKKNHENKISIQLEQSNSKYLQDLDSLKILFSHIPILEFRGMAFKLPESISINFNAQDIFESFCLDLPHRYPFFDQELTKLFDDMLCKMDRLHDWIGGTISNTSYRLITMNEMMNTYTIDQIGYNAYVFDDIGNMRINKRFLNDMQQEQIYKNVPVLQQDFIYSHTNLIEYIRHNYNNVFAN